MNLLVKKKIGWLLAAGVLLLGCKEENFGLELPPDSQQTELKFVEFTLPATNVYFDSLRTDGQTNLLVGEYTDDVSGSVTTSSYAEFKFRNGHLPVDSIWLSDSVVLHQVNYSSSRLILDANEVITDEELASQHLELYELQDSIFGGVLYLSNKTISKGNFVGEGDISLDLPTVDFSNDTLFYPIEIPLDDFYGSGLFDNLFDNSSAARPLGFVIEGSLDNGIFLYDLLSDTSELLLEMTGIVTDTTGMDTSSDTTLIASFRLATLLNNVPIIENNFINVDRDRAGSDFELIEDRKELDPSFDFVYFNPLAGIHPKIDLTEFLEFAKSDTAENVFIQEARLSVELEENTTTGIDVDFARYYFTNKVDDEIQVNWPGILSNPFGTLMLNDGAYAGAQASVATHVYDTTLLIYEGSPTLFTQLVYDNARSEVDGILVEDRPELQQLIDHVQNLLLVSGNPLSIGNGVIRKDGIKLQIFYAQLKE